MSFRVQFPMGNPYAYKNCIEVGSIGLIYVTIWILIRIVLLYQIQIKCACRLPTMAMLSLLFPHSPRVSKRWISGKYTCYLLCVLWMLMYLCERIRIFHNVELVKGIYYSDVSTIQSFPVVFQHFIYSSGDICSISMFSEHILLVMHLMYMAFLQMCLQ